MPARDQNPLPYRSAFPQVSAAATVTSEDEVHYDTLKVIRNLLKESIDGLHKDFNAFDVLKQDDTGVAAQKLLREIEAKQMAWDILSPVYEAVTSAMQKVDSKYKE